MLHAEEISVDKIKAGMGGYKKKETKEFVDNIRSEYENLYKENQELKEKISVLSEGVQYYKNMESSLQKALVLAERTTTETVHAAEVKAEAMEKEAVAKAELITKEAKMRAENYEKEANMKAEAMLRDAKHKADLAVAKGNEELQKVHSQVVTLVQQYEQYKAQYKQLALAQMNVLESEAYNLDAPILKTIEEVLSQRPGEEPEQRPKEEFKTEDKEREQELRFETSDKKETSAFDMSDIMEPIRPENTSDEEKESEVYVDGRGQVYEVHEFREVTPPIAGERDPYFDEEPLEEEDDWSVPSSMEKQSFETEEKNPADFFKPFESKKEEKIDSVDYATEEEFSTPLKEEQKQETAQSFLNREEISEEKIEKEEEPDNSELETMKRIERMQLERLRQEEEMQAKRMKMGAGFVPESFEQAEEQEEQNEPKVEEVRLSDEDSAVDFFAGLSNSEEEAPISLQELRKQQEDENENVPLPKASNENAYFSSSFSEVERYEKKEESQMPSETATSFSFEEEQNEEEKGVTDNFEQLSSDWLTNSLTDDKTSENSIDFELSHTNYHPSEKKERGGFKSFRDFESEL